MYGRVARRCTQRLSLRSLLERSSPPRSGRERLPSSAGRPRRAALSLTANSSRLVARRHIAAMYPAYRSYSQPAQPDRRGMFYRFYDRYRIFNDRRFRPFPFRFYCESARPCFSEVSSRNIGKGADHPEKRKGNKGGGRELKNPSFDIFFFVYLAFSSGKD